MTTKNEVYLSFDTQESVSQILHNFKWAVATKDWGRGVNFYQRTVAKILSRKFEFKINERVELVWLLWGIITEPEKPDPVNLKKLVALLSKLLRFDLLLFCDLCRKHAELKKAGLELPWRPLYDTVNQCCFVKWKTPD